MYVMRSFWKLYFISYQTYVKGDDPDKFCADDDKFLKIQIDADDEPGSLSTRIDTSQSYFTLKVTASQTNLSGKNLRIIWLPLVKPKG